MSRIKMIDKKGNQSEELGVKPSHLKQAGIHPQQDDPHHQGKDHSRRCNVTVKFAFHDRQNACHILLVFVFHMIDKKAKNVEKSGKPAYDTNQMKGFYSQVKHVF